VARQYYSLEIMIIAAIGFSPPKNSKIHLMHVSRFRPSGSAPFPQGQIMNGNR